MSDTFDAAASDYDELMADSIGFAGQEHDYYLRRKAEVMAGLVERRLGDPAGCTALDVGCGVGSMARHLHTTFGTLVGLDPSTVSAAGAARTVPEGSWSAAEGRFLPIASGSVDLAFAVNVLHHVEPPDRASVVAEMTRVVRPGGLVVAFEHNPLNPATRWSVAHCEFDEGVVLVRQRALRRVFVEAGLSAVERRYVLFSPFDVRWHHRVEGRLGWLPAGAQYVVAGTVG